MSTAAHYRITSDEFLSINSQLTNAQLRVYLHYKTLDPFGDRKVEICTKAIAEALGITRRSVQLALNKLSSMGLLIWQKAKSFVMAKFGSHSETKIAAAKCRSPRRNVDRERQLELNLGEDFKTSQSSSSLFKLDHDQGDEILNDSGDVINYVSIEEEISLDEALAEIRKSMGDESLDENDHLLDEDLDLNNEDEELQEVEEIAEPKTGLQLSTDTKSNGTAEGGFTRAAVEDFVLKSLNKSPKNRAAYFAKFSAASWKMWEKKYRDSQVVTTAYKPYVPEKVEVAAPDSPVAQSAIAFIKKKLGMK